MPAIAVLGRYEDGAPALVRKGRVHYLATLTDDAALTELLITLAAEGRARNCASRR